MSYLRDHGKHLFKTLFGKYLLLYKNMKTWGSGVMMKVFTFK